MDALHNSHLAGAGTQIRCSRCQLILFNGRCLDCAEGESNVFSFGLPQQVPPTGANEDVVMEAVDVCSGSIDIEEARYIATDDYEGENCDEFRSPRGHDDEDIFGFAALAQHPVVPQVIRAGSP